jgi:hypothetical protein
VPINNNNNNNNTMWILKILALLGFFDTKIYYTKLQIKPNKVTTIDFSYLSSMNVENM